MDENVQATAEGDEAMAEDGQFIAEGQSIEEGEDQYFEDGEHIVDEDEAMAVVVEVAEAAAIRYVR